MMSDDDFEKAFERAATHFHTFVEDNGFLTYWDERLITDFFEE